MLTEQQYIDAITYIKDFKDALLCVEQINERRASTQHYADFSSVILEAVNKGQLKIGDKRIEKGSEFDKFPLLNMMKFSNNLLKEFGLLYATSGEELSKKFDAALSSDKLV